MVILISYKNNNVYENIFVLYNHFHAYADNSSMWKASYENKEFYKQEVYIINSESTSATEREITGVQAYTFVDTLKIINDSYDTDTLVDYKVGTAILFSK